MEEVDFTLRIGQKFLDKRDKIFYELVEVEGDVLIFKADYRTQFVNIEDFEDVFDES